MSVRCKKELYFKFKIFAGVTNWREVKPEEMEVEALKINGVVAYGTVKLLGEK